MHHGCYKTCYKPSQHEKDYYPREKFCSLSAHSRALTPGTFVMPLKNFILMNPICISKQNRIPLFSSENYPEPNCGRVSGTMPEGGKKIIATREKMRENLFFLKKVHETQHKTKASSSHKPRIV